MPRGAGADPAVSQILDALRRILRTLRLADRHIEQRLGISGAQLFTLQQLARSPAQSINELAELTHTHQSSVSVVVRRLVDRRLAARNPSSEDARRVVLRITPAGQALLRRAPTAPQIRLIEALERMPRATLRRLAKLLGYVVREIGAAGQPPSMFFEESPSPGRKRAARRRPRASR